MKYMYKDPNYSKYIETIIARVRYSQILDYKYGIK